MIRRKARELALKMLYQMDTNGDDPEIALLSYCEAFPYKKEVVDYTREILSGVKRNRGIIDECIRNSCEHWSFERITPIDRNILRIGTYELLFSLDVPPKVAIDEAIELSKKYGNEDSYRFVNGILDRIFKSYYEKKGEKRL